MGVTITSTLKQMQWGLATQRWSETGVKWANAATYTEYVVGVDESLRLQDSTAKNKQKAIGERLSMSDSRGQEFHAMREFYESVTASNSGVSKHEEKSLRETIGLSESRGRSFHKVSIESIVAFEWETDPSFYTRLFNERISCRDSCVKTLEKHSVETITSHDDLLLPFLAGVISEIGIKRRETPPVELPELVHNSSAMGFSNWSAFATGDYDYREAIVKMVIKNPNFASVRDVGVSEHRFVCDVEDIVDKRVDAVGASPTLIRFTRSFGRPPVVSVTAIGSTEFVVPTISNVTRDGFMAELKNINGQTVPGNIHWTAFGY